MLKQVMMIYATVIFMFISIFPLFTGKRYMNVSRSQCVTIFKVKQIWGLIKYLLIYDSVNVNINEHGIIDLLFYPSSQKTKD